MKEISDKRTDTGRSRLLSGAVALILLTAAIGMSVFYPRRDVPAAETAVQPLTDMPSQTDAPLPTQADLPLQEEEANPIDAFFDTYSLDDSTSSNRHMRAYNIARADAWLAEVEHGYSLLSSVINPAIDEEGRDTLFGQIERSKESFLLYVEESTDLEATAASSNVFATDAPDENIMYGSAYGGYRFWLKGEQYRTEALRLYSMLEYICGFESPDDAFVFDSAAFLASAQENYDIVLTDGSEGDGQ